MDCNLITAAAVRDALRAVRYAKPLRGSPLLDLALLSARLEQAGLAMSPANREAQLVALLEDVSAQALNHVRLGCGNGAPTASLVALHLDQASGWAERQAWGLLYFRYFGPPTTTLRATADDLGVVYRTLARHLELGHRLLAARLCLLEEHIVYWQGSGVWLGYLRDYPGDWTQGKTIEGLKGHLRDLHADMASGAIPDIRTHGRPE